MNNSQIIEITLISDYDKDIGARGSLFDELNKRIEEQNRIHKSRSSSTGSPDDSEDEIDKILLEHTNKLFCCKNGVSKGKQMLATQILSQILDEDYEKIRIVERVKDCAKQQAFRTNSCLEYILQDSSLPFSNELSAFDLFKQFDQCLEMIEVLQQVYHEMKSIIVQIECEELSSDSTWESTNPQLQKIFIKQFLFYCPMSKTICETIQLLLSTSLFEDQSQQVLQSLLFLSSLTKKSNSSYLKSPALDYTTLLNRINCLSNNQDSLIIDLSQPFLESFRKKNSKSKVKGKKTK